MGAEIVSIPTGIPSLDAYVGGGFPDGSLVLILTDVGAGGIDFVNTAVIMSSAIKSGKLSTPHVKGIELPQKIIYVSISSGKDDLAREISQSFAKENLEFFRKVAVKDLSGLYLRALPRPFGKGLGVRGVLQKLVAFLKQSGGRNLVVINSLTDLALVGRRSMEEVSGFVGWLQRMTKRWGGIVYLVMDKGILDERVEEELSSLSDGVIRIRWDEIGVHRIRTMSFRKFRGLFPKLGKISRYEIAVSPQAGFTVSKWEMVEGIR